MSLASCVVEKGLCESIHWIGVCVNAIYIWVFSVFFLSRLKDSTDLARCRLVSNTLNSASSEVRSLTLICSMSRYLNSRSPETKHLITPFKIVFNNLVLRSPNLESVTIGVDRSLVEMPFDDFEDESDDLHLTDFNFLRFPTPLSRCLFLISGFNLVGDVHELCPASLPLVSQLLSSQLL